MKKSTMMAAAVALTAVVAACGLTGVVNIDGTVDAEEQALIDNAVTLIDAQVALWNEAGFDPVKIPAEQRAIAATACVSLSMVGALRDPAIGANVQRVCASVTRAAE